MANQLFENTNIWENYDESGIIKKKVQIIKSIIPKDVKTIADVGCGNGIITNKLNEQYDIIGIDSSKNALEFLNAPSLLASIENIPIKDNSFDLVLCSEVLEHVPQSILEKSVSELKRITSKYLLITVPNEEFLEKLNVKCPECGTIFHAYGHLHSYNLKLLNELVGDEFQVVKSFVGGPKGLEYNKALLKIRQNYAGKYFNPPNQLAYCEKCTNQTFLKVNGNLLSKICNGLNKIISRRKPYWLFVLYQKINSK